MKASRAEKTLTLGDFITTAHDTWGERRGNGMVRLAVNTHLIKFQQPQDFVFARAESQPVLQPDECSH